MPTYSYKARDENGSLILGTMEAESKQAVRMHLDSMGLFPGTISENLDQKSSFSDVLARFHRVKDDDLIFFTRQLHTIIHSGIPLIAGLKALEEQTTNKRLKAATRHVYQDLDHGKSFSEALGNQGAIFSDLYVSMVKAGETGGALDDVLDRLSLLIEFQMKTKEMMMAAIRMPIITVLVLVAAFAILITFVVPKFMDIFKGAKMELPLPTKILILVNYVVQTYGLYLLGIIAALVITFVVFVRSERGTYLFDRFKLKIPLLGPIILKICMSRFANMLENLIRAGVPIIRTLDIVSRTVGNAFIATRIKEIEAKIERGKGISKPLKDAKIFPPLVIHLVSTGEETGSLEEMLKEVSTHYDREISYSVSRLGQWVEPILIMVLAGAVLFMALAIFMPWWNMMAVMKGGG